MTLEDTLREMKDTSELMVDLAYSALLYDNEEIARHVLELEDRIDAWDQAIQQEAVERAIEDGNVQKALVFIRMASSIEDIADGALQIADVVLRDIEPHPIVAEALRESDTSISTVTVPPDSPVEGRTLGELKVASETGAWVLAIRRGTSWIYGPDEHTPLQAGDLLVVRGPIEGAPALRRFLHVEGAA
ncbi:MAG: potassium channel family protein [Thermoplasmata archaeon]